ncbi:MAG: hypothetical protein ACK5N1_12100, partial [Gemmatimonas sp.]
MQRQMEVTAQPLIPRVMTSADGAEGIQIVHAHHDTTDRSVHFTLRLSPDANVRQLCVYVEQPLDLSATLARMKLPVVGSGFLSLATWYVWANLDEARAKGEEWRPGSEGSLCMDPPFIQQTFLDRRIPAGKPESIIADTVRLTTPFGIPAVVDPLLAYMRGRSFEQLRRAVMDLRGHSWFVTERSDIQRLELDASGAFRAAHGLLSHFAVRAMLLAPRYAGVLQYWDRAVSLRTNAPADPAGVISNAAHAVEALARLLVGDSANTAGAALSALAANGRIPQEVATLARHIHGRTSGDIGA